MLGPQRQLMICGKLDVFIFGSAEGERPTTFRCAELRRLEFSSSESLFQIPS